MVLVAGSKFLFYVCHDLSIAKLIRLWGKRDVASHADCHMTEETAQQGGHMFTKNTRKKK